MLFYLPVFLFLSINVHVYNNKYSRIELPRPVMGTIFLVFECMYVYLCVFVCVRVNHSRESYTAVGSYGDQDIRDLLSIMKIGATCCDHLSLAYGSWVSIKFQLCII